MALVSLAQAASALGDRQRAAGSLREGLHLSLDLGYHIGVADTLVGLADVAISTGHAVRAARLLGTAETITDRLGIPLLPHHALHRQTLAAARAALGEAAFTTAWAAGKALSLDEAVSEANMVSGERLIPASGLFTPREREVLELLTAGRSDREIGAALFIATRTVEGHVAHILANLGVGSRRAAVVAARASGLVVSPPPEEP